MDQPLYKPLKYTQIKNPVTEIINYIDERRKGSVSSLQTRWSKFNNQCMGGIEPNTIYSICGISGSGKSSFVNSLETDLFDLNKSKDFVVLSFNFEMLSSRQVGRKLSYKLKMTTSELYSGVKKITDNDFNRIKYVSKELNSYPI